jgi:16S rRNA processing protein RimM
MNLKNEKKHIGKIIDAHGIRGDVYGLVFSGDTSWITKTKTLDLVINDKIETFDIVKIKAFKKGFIAALKGFDNRNKAEEYKASEVWVDAKLFISKNGESLFLSEILNFKIFDKSMGKIGNVEAFSSNGAQDLLIIKNDTETIEIPFVKEFVVNIDYVLNEIHMNLPEGLLQINVNSGADKADDS